ncbi:MAG: sigma-70 family RNA polymerase sigma factor [Ktedonobacteraceae bacterium]
MTEPISPSLATREEDQQTARNRLVEQHLFLVPFLAKRVHSPYQGGLDLEDLLQEGYLGLMRAAELYDPQKINPATGQPYRFSGYATWWIRQKILRALSTQSRTICLPNDVAEDLHRLKRVQREMWERWQREPSPEELATEMPCPPARIRLLLDIKEVKSLDEALGSSSFSHDNDEEATTLADLLAAPDPLPRQREQQVEISDLLTYLSPEERRVIVCRYQLGQETRSGIEDIPLSYKEVARQVQKSSEHVKVVEERALRKMRYWAERPVFGKGE